MPSAARIALALAFSLLLLAPLVGAKSSISMELAMDEKYSKPQKVVAFPATFTATNNVRVVFEVLHAGEGLQAPIPNPIELSPGRADGAVVPFMVMTPYHNGYVDGSGDVAYRATPSDGSSPLEWTVKVHTRGFYLPGPGLAAVLGVLAAVAIASASRTRR